MAIFNSKLLVYQRGFGEIVVWNDGFFYVCQDVQS